MAVLDTMRTDIMHKAAVTIQRHARGFMVRRHTQRTRRAIIKIQVCYALGFFKTSGLNGNDDTVFPVAGMSLTTFATIRLWHAHASRVGLLQDTGTDLLASR